MEIKGDGEFYVDTPHGKAYLKYRIENNKMIIYETFTPVEERGKGIATTLTKYATEMAKNNNMEVIDECSFTTSFLQKNKENI